MIQHKLATLEEHCYDMRDVESCVNCRFGFEYAPNTHACVWRVRVITSGRDIVRAEYLGVNDRQVCDMYETNTEHKTTEV